MAERGDWYGWIPNLSGDLLPDYAESNQIENKLNEDEVEELGLSNEFEYFSWTEKVSDHDDGLLRKILLYLNEGFIEKAAICNEEMNAIISAECQIENTGLVKLLNLEGGPRDKLIARQIFIRVRDFYHSHTHHQGHEDLLLPPVTAFDNGEAVEKIIEKFREKVPKYHRQLNELEESSEVLMGTNESLDKTSRADATEIARETVHIAKMTKKGPGRNALCS